MSCSIADQPMSAARPSRARGQSQLLCELLDAHDVVARIGVLRFRPPREGDHPVALSIDDLDRRRSPAEHGGPGMVEQVAGQAAHQREGGGTDGPGVGLLETAGQTDEGRHRPEQERHVPRCQQTAAPPKR